MDTLAALVDGPRARGAFVLRSLLRPPWSLRVQNEAALTLLAVVRGTSWLVRDDADPVRLDEGDVAVVRGPEPYTVADDPATPPSVVIHPGQRCTTLHGESVAAQMGLGMRTWGNDPEGPDVLITGSYLLDGEIGRGLLTALPPRLVLRATDADGALLALLADEAGRDRPGQQAVLDRLLDVVLVAVLRGWLAGGGAAGPSPYAAQRDPVVGRAVQLLQNNPAYAWTVPDLAQRLGVSRAVLARRFTELVGEAPMTFLAGWRLALAADLLQDPSATVGAVARQVGYGSPFALSAAFKRVHGVSPTEHRRQLAGLERAG